MGVAGCQIHSIFWTPLLIEAVANAFKGLRLAGGQVRQIHRIPWVPLLVKAGQGPQDIARVNSGCDCEQPKVGVEFVTGLGYLCRRGCWPKTPKINESRRWPSDSPYSLLIKTGQRPQDIAKGTKSNSCCPDLAVGLSHRQPSDPPYSLATLADQGCPKIPGDDA